MMHLVPALLSIASTIAEADAAMDMRARTSPRDTHRGAHVTAVDVLVGIGVIAPGPVARAMTNPQDLVRPDLRYHVDPASLTDWLGALAIDDVVSAPDDRAAACVSSVQGLSVWCDAWEPLTHRDDGTSAPLESVELAHAQLGVDYRIARQIKVAPVLAGSVDTFLYQDSPTDYTELEAKKLNVTGFAGLSGQFDAGRGH